MPLDRPRRRPPDDVKICAELDEAHWTVEVAPPGATFQSWRLSLRFLREFFRDPDDTGKAFEFLFATGQKDMERYFQRFAAGPHGPRLLARKPSLADAIQDLAALAAMPAGSLGRTFLAFLQKYGYQALALHELVLRTRAKWEAEFNLPRVDADRLWFFDRFMLSHDLQHVVTGYGPDDLGEAALSAFTLGQQGGLGLTVLTLGATAKGAGEVGAYWAYYIYRAWRRGRAAQPLYAAPWEDLLPLPLDAARELLGIEPIRRAHPTGIWSRTFNRSGAGRTYGAPPDASP